MERRDARVLGCSLTSAAVPLVTIAVPAGVAGSGEVCSTESRPAAAPVQMPVPARRPGVPGSTPRLLIMLLLGAGILLPGCLWNSRSERPRRDPMPTRDIKAVLRDHDKELMAVPGVAVVYVGLMKDEKTLCIKVMAVRRTADLERRIPRSLEGYPVVVEETGVVRPLSKQLR